MVCVDFMPSEIAMTEETQTDLQGEVTRLKERLAFVEKKYQEDVERLTNQLNELTSRFDDTRFVRGRVTRNVSPEKNGIIRCIDTLSHSIANGEDNSVCIRDDKTLRTTSTLDGHVEPVLCVAFIDADTLASGSRDRTIKVWNLHSGESRTLKAHQGPVHCLKVQGKQLFSGGADKVIFTWNLEEARPEMLLKGHEGAVLSIDVDGDLLVSGSTDRSIRVWRTDTGRCEMTLRGHTGDITCMALSLSYIISGSADRTSRIWSLDSGVCLRILNHNDYVTSLSAVPFSDIIITGCADGLFRMWSLSNGECQRCFVEGEGQCDVKVNGKKVVTAGGKLSGSRVAPAFTRRKTPVNERFLPHTKLGAYLPHLEVQMHYLDVSPAQRHVSRWISGWKCMDLYRSTSIYASVDLSLSVSTHRVEEADGRVYGGRCTSRQGKRGDQTFETLYLLTGRMVGLSDGHKKKNNTATTTTTIKMPKMKITFLTSRDERASSSSSAPDYTIDLGRRRVFIYSVDGDGWKMKDPKRASLYENPRRTFSLQQQLELLDLFHKTKYPSKEQKDALAKKFNVKRRQIQIWFQNKRAPRVEANPTRLRGGGGAMLRRPPTRIEPQQDELENEWEQHVSTKNVQKRMPFQSTQDRIGLTLQQQQRILSQK
ncbi:hypothetical protein PROFUN_07181 [Planoprotostelium fungivorum]|uniref:Homeobox domain-containing protein n=1 Tax=Planoprotostelium fungivorum TaxID=1890364 RepID=A0A2P6NMC2_9EUKA|nr:hypothetical protein PROFUN_07181 [Planoprotostelium fungivorum]